MLNRHHRLALLACTATLALSVASGSFAQSATTSQPTEAEESEAAKKGETYLSPIVAKGGREADPYTKPGPSSVVSTDQIELQAGQETDDLLRSVPGTSTANNPQNPGVAVNIRGFEGSGRVNMMIDGVRQNFRFTGHEAQGFAYVDPAFLSEIDLTRGAVTGIGGGALAGSVNFKTYDIEDLIQDGKNYGGQAVATYGSNGAGWSESLLGAYRFNDVFSVLGGISKSDPGNYDNGDGIEVPFTEEDLLSGLLKAEITPDKDHSFKFSAISYDNDFFANSYFQNVRNQTVSANYAYTPDNELIDFRANSYWNRLRMKYDTNLLGAGGAAGRRITDTGIGFDISNTSTFDLGEVAVRSNYGVEYFQDDYDVINSTAQPTGGVNGGGKNATTGIFNSTTFTYGIVDLTAGLRYDQFNIDGTGSVSAGNPLGMPAGAYSVDESDGRLNPSVTLAVNATEWLQPYVTYAETSRAPTVNEIFVGGSHPGGFQMFFPNPFLQPEISKGWEIGANINLDDLIATGDSFRLKANYFHNRVDNYITAALANGGMQIFFVNNPGISTVQGFELQAAYDAGYVFGDLAYTHTESDLPSQVNGFGVQSFLPDDIVSATLGARFLEEQRLTVGTRIHAVSNAFIGEENAGASGSATVPGYGLVDLFANYKFENGLELTGSVTNVFDKTYTPASSTIAGSTVDTGRGRTFLVTAKAKF
ncbi:MULTISPECIES: TonB-dependent receptor [Sinorhizobium]|uniref:TonB-dependent receptor domain-containing protein n=1 Tax=Sinorhizobium TaxID=28105 RepID=UPI000BE7FCF0|nr:MULTISPECIES: TonB-dependent receptor [Sinorhizobium]PDT54372.1 hemin receptor [Sinorhizobium sp. NG07B]POH31423.1 hemin receptor [Sinorhizobium americanum]